MPRTSAPAGRVRPSGRAAAADGRFASRSPRRTELPVRAARLEAAGRLTVIGAADLVFDARESAELLHAAAASEPTPHEVDAVLDATEGWPLGVAAAALAGVRGLAGPAGAAERARVRLPRRGGARQPARGAAAPARGLGAGGRARRGHAGGARARRDVSRRGPRARAVPQTGAAPAPPATTRCSARCSCAAARRAPTPGCTPASAPRCRRPGGRAAVDHWLAADARRRPRARSRPPARRSPARRPSACSAWLERLPAGRARPARPRAARGQRSSRGGRRARPRDRAPAGRHRGLRRARGPLCEWLGALPARRRADLVGRARGGAAARRRLRGPAAAGCRPRRRPR